MADYYHGFYYVLKKTRYFVPPRTTHTTQIESRNGFHNIKKQPTYAWKRY